MDSETICSTNLDGTISIGLLVIMAIAIVLVFAERLKSGRGLGARSIQVLAVVMIVPAILLLAIRGNIKGEAVASLIGALVGYVLAGVGDYKPKTKPKSETPGANTESNQND